MKEFKPKQEHPQQQLLLLLFLFSLKTEKQDHGTPQATPEVLLLK